MDYEPLAGERRVLWTDPEGDQWLLVFQFVTLDGRSKCVGFEMRSFVKDVEKRQEVKAPGPVKPLTATLHRAVPFEAMSHDAKRKGSPFVPRAMYEMMEELGIKPEEGRTVWDAMESRAVGDDRPPGRPRQYDEDHFREVAAVYLKADRDDFPATREVQRYFADKWGEDVTRSQAAKWVYRARHEFGLLGETEPRQQGQKENDDA